MVYKVSAPKLLTRAILNNNIMAVLNVLHYVYRTYIETYIGLPKFKMLVLVFKKLKLFGTGKNCLLPYESVWLFELNVSWGFSLCAVVT